RFGDRTWTYRDVAERSRALARALIDGGLTPEQRVYIVLPDTPAFAWSIFGTLAAGGVVTMGNPISPVEDLAYVIDYVRAAAMIRRPEVGANFGSNVPVRLLLAPDAATGDDPEPAGSTLAQAIGRGRESKTPLPKVRRDDPAIWLFTSGSTGRAKAAMHS